MNISVLGSGICGITSALAIQSHFPTSRVSIIADKFNEDTLSAGAAGIFRPGSGLRRQDGGDASPWIKSAYDFYNSILQSSSASQAGVMRVDGYLFSSTEPGVVRNKLLEGLLPVYRSATDEEVAEICPHNGFKYGAYFQTMVIECTSFLPWALEKFRQNGGHVVSQKVDSFDDINSSDVIINCSGLRAKWLCGDDRVVPIRGQVFKVRAPWIKMFYYGDYDTYIIPGANLITLGGTRNFDSYNEQVDPFDSQSILTRCTKLVPNLAKAEVVKEWVGLRPYRDAVRVEFDRAYAERKGQNIIHNYGHGGYGITSAPGTAQEVVKILEDLIKTSKSKL